MQRSEVVATAAGPTTPIILNNGSFQADTKGGGSIAPLYLLQPSIWGHISPNGVLQWRWEVTADLPDATGAWPSPGNWTVYDIGLGVPFSTSMFYQLGLMATAIRANVTSYASGSLTLRVLQ